MPNGTYKPLVDEILEKAIKVGISALEAKEISILVLSEFHNLSEHQKAVFQGIVLRDAQSAEEHKQLLRAVEKLGQPVWRTWNPKDLVIGGAVLAGFLGVVRWDMVQAGLKFLEAVR